MTTASHALLCLALDARVVVAVAATVPSVSRDDLPGAVDLIAVSSTAEFAARESAPVDVALIEPPDAQTEAFTTLLDAVRLRLRPGAVLFSAAPSAWYVAYLRDPSHGYRTSVSAMGALALWDPPVAATGRPNSA